MKQPLESEIQKSIIDYLELMKFVVVKVNNGGVYVKKRDCFIPPRSKGVADILCCWPETGQFVAIEVKRPGGVVSEDQKQFLERVKKANGLAMVAYSLDEVIELVEKKTIQRLFE